jgi:hypothetical protein
MGYLPGPGPVEGGDPLPREGDGTNGTAPDLDFDVPVDPVVGSAPAIAVESTVRTTRHSVLVLATRAVHF